MTYICLDLGTKMGFAVNTTVDQPLKFSEKIKISCDSTGSITHGSIEFKTTRFSGGGLVYVQFQHVLNVLYNTFKFDRLYFEEVRAHAGIDAAHKYGGFLALLTAFCEERGIPYEGIPVQTIKKQITGSGAAPKELVMLNVFKKLAIRAKSSDEADAVAILYTVENR